MSIFVIQACSKNDNSYFPLAEGYQWRYDVTKITRDGLENQKYFLKNLGEKEIGDKSAYVRSSLDGTTHYYTENEEGISLLGSINNNDLNPLFEPDEQWVLQYPLAVGSGWQQKTITKLLKKTGPPQKTEFKIIANVPTEVKIVSFDESVKVPAGVFENCMKVSMTGSMFKDAGNYVGLTVLNVEQTSWYAKGVGLVKLERLEKTQSDALDKGSLLVELADFKD